MLGLKNFNAIHVIIITLLIAILVISIISVTKKVSCKNNVSCPKPQCPKPDIHLSCSPPEINLSCPEKCPDPCKIINLRKEFHKDMKKIIYNSDPTMTDELKDKFFNNNEDLIGAVYNNSDLYDFYKLILTSNGDTVFINFMYLFVQELNIILNWTKNDIKRNNITVKEHTKNIINIVYIIYLIKTYIKDLEGTIPSTPLKYYCSLIACNSSKSILQPPITVDDISSSNSNGSKNSIFNSLTGKFNINPDSPIASLIIDCLQIIKLVGKQSRSINYSNNNNILTFEIRPRTYEDPDIVVSNAKRTLNKAFQMLE